MDLEDLGERELRWGLVEKVARLQLGESVRQQVLPLCRAFLEQLSVVGRLGGGEALGRYVGALGNVFKEASGVKKPIQNVASKLNRNDPCPCGSGQKYKKCCMRLLDS